MGFKDYYCVITGNRWITSRNEFLKSLRFTLKWTDVRTGSEAVEKVEEEDETSDNDSDYSEASVDDSEDENDGALRPTISYAYTHLFPSPILPLSLPRPHRYETAEQPKYVLPIPDSDTIVRGLRISKEDLDSANRFILLCYTDVDANGQRTIYDDPLNGLPIPIKRPAKGPMERITQSSVWVHWDVVPGDDPGDGVFDVIEKNRDKTTTQRPVKYWVNSQTFLINYDAFLIIQGVFFPRKTLAPHVLFDLLWHFDRLPYHAVRVSEAADLVKEYKDYYSQPRAYISEVVRPWTNPISLANLGPTAKAAGQDLDLLALAEPVKNEDDTKGKVKFFKPLLKDKTKTAEEKLRELWLGDGNLWCLVAPNKFPVAETVSSPPLATFASDPPKSALPSSAFESLPTDVLLNILLYLAPRAIADILATSKRLRSVLLPHAHLAAYKSIRIWRPHILPVGSIYCDEFHPDHPNIPDSAPRGNGGPKGGEEADAWVAMWKEGGYHIDDSECEWWADNAAISKIPWLNYAREATKSASMKNRWRIWGIGIQLDMLLDVLEGEREKLEEAKE